jgi:hypothetical protein
VKWGGGMVFEDYNSKGNETENNVRVKEGR